MNLIRTTVAIATLSILAVGCDTEGTPGNENLSAPSATVDVVDGRLSIESRTAFESMIEQAKAWSSPERIAWERETGFQSLQTALENELGAESLDTLTSPTTPRGLPVVRDREMASLLNAGGELLYDGHLLVVDGETATLSDAQGETVATSQVRTVETYSVPMSNVECFDCEGGGSGGGGGTGGGGTGGSGNGGPMPSTHTQKEFGPVSQLAIEHNDSRQQKEFQITGTIKKVDYVVYARWSGGTEVERLQHSFWRGLYYGETIATRVSLACEVGSENTPFNVSQDYDSDVEINFDTNFVDPFSLKAISGTAGTYFVTAEAVCRHDAKASVNGTEYDARVHTAW